MKKVIIPEPKVETLSIENLDFETNYHGIEFNGVKYMVIRDNVENKYRTLCTVKGVPPNEMHKECECPYALLRHLIENGGIVYAFDNHKALYKWLSE